MEDTQTRTKQSFVKFIPQPERYPIQLQKRDLKILHLIFEYRFARSDFVVKLIDGSERNILKRLQKLFHQGYLDRITDRRIRTRSGSDKMVYAITKKAADLLAAELEIELPKLNWAWKNRQVTERHVKHTLMINKFRTAVNLAAKETEGVSLAFWKENRGSGKNIDPELSVKLTVRTGQGREEKRRIVPDAFLCLEDPDYNYFLYLEADRSTMAVHRFLKKVENYWVWYDVGGAKKKHGIKKFRVLTITQSERRRDNLRNAIIAARKDRKLEVGGGMFWFASEKDFSIDNPANVFAPIWLTAKDAKLHALLE